MQVNFTDDLMANLAKMIRNIVRDETSRALKANRPASYNRTKAAKLIGISKNTLIGLIDSRKIRTSTDGTRIPTTEIDRYLNER